MDLSLFFAGTAGSVPTARRGLPAIAAARRAATGILFDCGEGTQQQLLRSIGLPELDAIFITHFHLDHWLGLVGMLKTFDLRARERPLTIHGPPGLQGAVRDAAAGARAHRLPALAGRARAARGGPLRRLPDRPFPVKHRVEAYGYAFVEDDRPGRFDADEAAPRSASSRGPGLRAPAARRDRRRRDARSRSSGETAPGPPDRALGRHRAVPGRRGARPRRRRARARGDVPRRRARPRARDRPLDRARRPPSWPATPACACSR